MKLQGLGIVFAIIILPVIIILSYYIQISVDTIALQTSYKSKLNTSTYDSMLAFEMNTANENLSTVADSLRSIIEASNSVFFDSLASNFGMSNANKSLFQAYVPAILYTLYDGYYIYSPTEQPEILTYQDWMLDTSAGLFSSDSEDSTTIGSTNKITITRSAIENYGGQPIYSPSGQFIYKLKDDSTSSPDYTIGSRKYSLTLDDNVKYKVDYILKSYMPYSARYVHTPAGATKSSHDITINYTLDNYLNIMGTIDDVYYSKTGHLIDPYCIESISIEAYNYDNDGKYIGRVGAKDASGNDIDSNYILGKKNDSSGFREGGLNEDEAEELCLSGKYRIELILKCKDSPTSTIKIVSDPRSLDIEPTGTFNKSGAREDEIQKQLNADYEIWHNNSYSIDSDKMTKASEMLDRIQKEEAELANMRAVAYYVRSSIFSNWVYSNLKEIEASDIQNSIIEGTVKQYLASIGNNYENQTASVDTLFQVFNGDNTKIFGSKDQDTDLESAFTNHKDGVIRNSIQYNLDLAFSSYTEMYSGNLSFQMPVISDAEWERIINSVSVVSFMQGMPCGTKNFNSYSIANSTNNELTVIPSEIYYIPTNQFSDGETDHYAHRVDCDNLTAGWGSIPDDGYKDAYSRYISMKSNDVKYDGIYNKNNPRYEYSFRNLLDYSCIINKNLREKEFTIGGTEARVQRLDPSKWVNDAEKNYDNQRYAYYTGVAEQRQKLYKTNALTESCGYTYKSYPGNSNGFDTRTTGEDALEKIDLSGGKQLKDVKEFEFYFNTFQVRGGSPSITVSIIADDQKLELYGKDTQGNEMWDSQMNYTDLSSGNGTNLTIRARCHIDSANTNASATSITIKFKENKDLLSVDGSCIGVKVIYK